MSLEDLARQGKQANERRQAEIEREAARHVREQSDDELVDDALGGAASPAAWGVGVVAATGAAVAAGLTLGLSGAAAGGLGVAGALVAAVALHVLGDRWHRAAERRWLAALPYQFDAGAYLGLLRGRHDGCRMSVAVSFAAAVPHAARAVVVDAVIGAIDASPYVADDRRSSATWRGDELEVTSGRLAARFGGYQDGAEGAYVQSHHGNRPLHRWFRRCVGRGLAAVHARHPIAALRVTVRKAA
jgi:hypothetical protein